MKNSKSLKFIYSFLRKRIQYIRFLNLIYVFLLGAILNTGAAAYSLHGNIIQGITVTGVVNDEKGESMPGVNIMIKGTATGVVSDVNGRFSINVPNTDAVLVFTFIGYIKKEIKIGEQRMIQVAMAEDALMLDEVVVTALGMKRATKAIGYAVTEIRGDDLNFNVINPVSALQGKVAGVEIAQSDGGMFGSTKILIRGSSTLGKNNQPIYVVDGIILDNAIKDGNADWSTTDRDWGNELKNLNPDDFETVSVLKGAAATALYGSRGLNGAVVITTKSGRRGQGLGITVSQTLGIDHMFRQPDLQNKYGNGQYTGNVAYGERDADGNYYKYDNLGQFYLNSKNEHTLVGSNNRHWGPAFDGSPIEYYDYTTARYSPVKNNMKDAFDLGFNTNTNVAIQGGNDKTAFYSSLSYKYAKGTLPNNSFERVAFLGKASHKITDRVEVEASMSFSNSAPRNAMPNIGEYFVDSGNGDFMGRTYDSRYYRDKYKGSHGGLAQASYGDEYGYVPARGFWWNVFENDFRQKETSVRPTLNLTVGLTDWLSFRAEGNYNYYYRRAENKEPGRDYANAGGYYMMSLYSKEQTNLNASFNFNKSVGNWGFGGFVRGEYYHNFQQEMSENTSGGLVVPNQFFIGNSKDRAVFSGKISGEKTMLSVVFQAGMSWKDQVYIDVTGRNDWSSALVYSDGHGTYSYFYPSVSGSWLLSETFRDELPQWVSFAKLRASWAQVGNDTSPYTINSAYSLTTSTVNGGDNVFSLSIPSTAYSSNLKPERKNAWELGLDWRFLQNRIGIDVTYYKENTKNQIMSISVPGVSGINNQLINAGNIQNQGLEIALNTVPFRNTDWRWDLNFTYTKNKNKIVELHENVADYIALTGNFDYGNYRVGSVAKVGEAYGLLMSDATAAIDEKTGLPILSTSYYDYNEMHAMFYQRDGSAKVVGSLVPDFLGSIHTILTYKNVSLRASFDMRFGGYVASYTNRYGMAYGLTESSLAYRDSKNGGMTYTSIWDGNTYHDGIIPVGLVPGGTTISVPNGGIYQVKDDGETYEALYSNKIVDPQHGSSWNYWNNAWSTGTINDNWFNKLNYIALREITLSYRMPSNLAEKIGAKDMVFSLSGRNLGYLLNSMPNKVNPESVRGTSATEFRIRSFNGYTANYTFNVNVGF